MLRLSKALYEEMVTHCQSKYPKEACGVLAGKDGAVEQVYPMTNVEDSPIGYSMDPKEQLLIEKKMRNNHQRMVGIYHSHTATDAYPSSVDVSLAIAPEIAYVLVSLKDRTHPVLKSYTIDGRQVTEQPLVISEA